MIYGEREKEIRRISRFDIIEYYLNKFNNSIDLLSKFYEIQSEIGCKYRISINPRYLILHGSTWITGLFVI